MDNKDKPHDCGNNEETPATGNNFVRSNKGDSNKNKLAKIKDKSGDDDMENIVERETLIKNSIHNSKEHNFSDIYETGEEFAKLLGIKDCKDVCKILKKK